MTNKIEEILGMDYDKLLIAGIVQQGDLASIIDEGPKKFKETLNSIIGIDKLDAAAASMGDAIKQFRTYVREKFGYDDTSIPQIEIELEKTLPRCNPATFEPRFVIISYKERASIAIFSRLH